MEERPPEQDPDRLAEQVEREADELEHRGDEVGDGIDAARRDWERKQEDDGVPGAVPDPEGREEPAEDDGGG